ncbi:Glutathione peroxidase 2 [Entomophthora muscae]|uniref:Glutathione peroxidase 2 n=1 Tax=Entomophthora muscae TaxID=34485 RepID=A0ACC2RMJ0_9FUNG|nr:Glutathione peroxidase 2 [Entomophthora muscae]
MEDTRSDDKHIDEKPKSDTSHIDENHISDDKRPVEKPASNTKQNDPKINLGYKLIFTISLLVSILSYIYCTNFSTLDSDRKIHLQNAELELSQTSIYSFTASDIKFSPFNFDSLKGKVVLIVNVASECGFTSQYGGLQKMYVDLKGRGFEIIAFPSDQFSQELDTEQEIYDFCTSTFGVTFPLMAKVQLNGNKAHPIYKYLTKVKPSMLGTNSVKWNFEKFLIDRKGNVVERYSSIVTPEKLRPDVEGLLG